MPERLRYMEIMRTHEHNSPGVSALAFSSNGSYLATAGFDGRVCVWGMKDYRLLHEYRSTTSVCSLEWVRNGEDSIVIGYQDGNVATLSLTANMLSLHGFHAHDYSVDCLANRNTMIATAAQHEVRVWEWHPLAPWKLCIGLADPPKSAESLSREVLVVNLHWTSSGGHPSVLLVSYQNHGIFMYESANWTMVHQLRCGHSIARSTLSPDGSLLALYKLTAGIEIRLVSDDSVKCAFPKRRGVSSLVPVLFIHGGRAIAVGSTTGQVEIWDVASATHIQTLVHQGDNNVLSLAAHYKYEDDTFMIATGTCGDQGRQHVRVWVTAKELMDQDAQIEKADVAAAEDDSNEVLPVPMHLPWLIAMATGAILFIVIVLAPDVVL